MTQPPLFEFSLDPLDDVHAWGSAPDRSLSWFGLTQGRYRVNAGGQRLLNYSDAMVAKHAADWPDAYPGPLVDYYVVRLWEDVLALLPEIVTPLPRALHDIALLPDAERSAWMEGLASALPDDQFEDATAWLASRVLDSGYLQHGPWLRLWSCEGETFIAWDCTRHVRDGVPVWSATTGHHAMPTEDFVAGVADFHARLIAGMADRVADIARGWHRDGVKIDVPALEMEHTQRAKALDIALARAPASFERGHDILAQAARG